MRAASFISGTLLLICLPQLAAAQSPLAVASDICTDPAADFDTRNAALKSAGWSQDVPETVKLEWAVSAGAIAWLVMQAGKPGPALDAFIANSERRYATVAGNRSEFWQRDSNDAVVRVVETPLSAESTFIACEYLGRHQSGSTDVVLGSSRFANELRTLDTFPLPATVVSADMQMMSAKRPANGWHPNALSVTDYTGRRDLLSNGVAFEYPVYFISVSQYFSAPS